MNMTYKITLHSNKAFMYVWVRSGELFLKVDPHRNVYVYRKFDVVNGLFSFLLIMAIMLSYKILIKYWSFSINRSTRNPSASLSLISTKRQSDTSFDLVSCFSQQLTGRLMSSEMLKWSERKNRIGRRKKSQKPIQEN